MYYSLSLLSLCLLTCMNICCVPFFWLCLSLQKPVKKKGSYPLHPGVQGFFITCDGGREHQASREAINVIDSVCFLSFLSSSFHFFLQNPSRRNWKSIHAVTNAVGGFGRIIWFMVQGELISGCPFKPWFWVLMPSKIRLWRVLKDSEGYSTNYGPKKIFIVS